MPTGHLKSQWGRLGLLPYFSYLCFSISTSFPRALIQQQYGCGRSRHQPPILHILSMRLIMGLGHWPQSSLLLPSYLIYKPASVSVSSSLPFPFPSAQETTCKCLVTSPNNRFPELLKSPKWASRTDARPQFGPVPQDAKDQRKRKQVVEDNTLKLPVQLLQKRAGGWTMAQPLRALTILVEGPGSVPDTHGS